MSTKDSERRLDELEEELATAQKHLSRRIATVMKRVTALEELAAGGTLQIETELTEMERILTGLDDKPQVGTSRARAVILAELFATLSTRTQNKRIITMDRDNLVKNVSQAEINQEGSKLDEHSLLSSKQISRAMDSFVDMTDGKAERRHSKRGVNILVMHQKDYEEMFWSAEALRERIQSVD